ncbi:hypothetical protein EUGRSUZ_E03318 [Eucalyptus grandis]|uniref:Uncharacterized protein n=2 Tax=Eucalyptus grandis TaxID=71139 RepID=A0ACC3KZE8_EUCGR|nr:hypothetical protein EUGRSUZ_E03318 [Eucalyptus grandis]
MLMLPLMKHNSILNLYGKGQTIFLTHLYFCYFIRKLLTLKRLSCSCIMSPSYRGFAPVLVTQRLLPTDH